jgi:hypothetical protein
MKLTAKESSEAQSDSMPEAEPVEAHVIDWFR